MMVKVEEQQDPALPRPAGAEPMSPFDDYYYGADEEEYYEETDSEGEGEGDGAPQLKKGPWTPEEDRRLRDYVQANGEGNWNQVRINAGLNRCGKSCRLRWSNHLRPDLKKGPFDDEEVDKILRMHYNWGNKWAKMAAVLPGRTDNEIKNFWNTRLKRHQRAHLPIYPEYLISESSNQDMDFGTPEASFGTKQNELSQNILESDDLINDYFDHKIFYKRLPVPSVDVPCPSLVGPNSLQMDAMDPLMKLLNPSAYTASEYNGTLSYVQIRDESEKLACSTSFYGMTDNHLATPGNAIVREHDYPMFNGNSSTSWTTQMPMKTELPSVQYYPYNFSDNNAWVGDCPSGSIEQADNLNESPGSISSQNTSLDAILHSGGGLVDPIVQSQGVFHDGMFPTFTYNQVQPTNVYAILPSVPGDDEEFDSFHLGEVQAPKSPSTSSPTEVGTHDASPEASLLNDMFLKDPSISIYNSLMEDYEEAKPSTAGTGLDSFGNGMPGASNVSYLSDL